MPAIMKYNLHDCPNSICDSNTAPGSNEAGTTHVAAVIQFELLDGTIPMKGQLIV